MQFPYQVSYQTILDLSFVIYFTQDYILQSTNSSKLSIPFGKLSKVHFKAKLFTFGILSEHLQYMSWSILRGYGFPLTL